MDEIENVQMEMMNGLKCKMIWIRIGAYYYYVYMV